MGSGKPKFRKVAKSCCRAEKALQQTASFQGSSSATHLCWQDAGTNIWNQQHGKTNQSRTTLERSQHPPMTSIPSHWARVGLGLSETQQSSARAAQGGSAASPKLKPALVLPQKLS